MQMSTNGHGNNCKFQQKITNFDKISQKNLKFYQMVAEKKFVKFGIQNCKFFAVLGLKKTNFD